MIHTRPSDPVLDKKTTAMWAHEIRRVAKDGDWILTRSYSAVGDAVVGLTSGESLSHASIYDAKKGTVIEAINPVVREIPLEQLLQRNRIAVVVRPVGQSEEAGRLALAKARTALGAQFDNAGLFGLDSADKFFCSELVAWASEVKHDEAVISPADLFERGEMVYLSGTRDEIEVQRAARYFEMKERVQVASAQR